MASDLTIDVQYRCECSPAWVVVPVPERRVDQETVDWCENVVRPTVYRALPCRCTHADLKLPIPTGSGMVGRHARQ